MDDPGVLARALLLEIYRPKFSRHTIILAPISNNVVLIQAHDEPRRSLVLLEQLKARRAADCFLCPCLAIARVDKHRQIEIAALAQATNARVLNQRHDASGLADCQGRCRHMAAVMRAYIVEVTI